MVTFSSFSTSIPWAVALPERVSQFSFDVKYRMVNNILHELQLRVGRSACVSAVLELYPELVVRDTFVPSLPFPDAEVEAQGAENVAKSDCSDW